MIGIWRESMASTNDYWVVTLFCILLMTHIKHIKAIIFYFKTGIEGECWLWILLPIDMYLNGSEVNMRGWLIVVFFRYFTILYYWPHETAWPNNQISVFRKCEPVVYARLGFWNNDYATLTELHWSVWEHQAWNFVNVKVLSPMTLIGSCMYNG